MTYDPAAYESSDRRMANEMSREVAEHNHQTWTTYEVEFVGEFWCAIHPGERDELGVALAIGRTVEACRMIAHKIRAGEEVVTVDEYTRTGRVTRTRVTTTTSRMVERRRPQWMDDEGLPDWYV